jgi:hypothetical protein
MYLLTVSAVRENSDSISLPERPLIHSSAFKKKVDLM